MKTIVCYKSTGHTTGTSPRLLHQLLWLMHSSQVVMTLAQAVLTLILAVETLEPVQNSCRLALKRLVWFNRIEYQQHSTPEIVGFLFEFFLPLDDLSRSEYFIHPSSAVQCNNMKSQYEIRM